MILVTHAVTLSRLVYSNSPDATYIKLRIGALGLLLALNHPSYVAFLAAVRLEAWKMVDFIFTFLFFFSLKAQ